MDVNSAVTMVCLPRWNATDKRYFDKWLHKTVYQLVLLLTYSQTNDVTVLTAK